MEEKSLFLADVEAYYIREYGTGAPSLRQKLRLWLLGCEFQCVAVYRLGRFAGSVSQRSKVLGAGLTTLHRILNKIVHIVYHVYIESSTEIGGGFYIGHIPTIYIGAKSIGANFTVMHNVTIGVGFTEGALGRPTIGNNVWVGSGCIVSGDITIGDGATIANGCILSRSLPVRCLAAGNPGRLILQDYDNSKLFRRFEP